MSQLIDMPNKKTNKKTNKTIDKTIVLAFSGGLDTSFCVPYLIEQGYQVTTIFVDSGGINEKDKESIKRRAYQLGANHHEEVCIADKLWKNVTDGLTTLRGVLT